jgi:hypothetical protein
MLKLVQDLVQESLPLPYCTDAAHIISLMHNYRGRLVIS